MTFLLEGFYSAKPERLLHTQQSFEYCRTPGQSCLSWSLPFRLEKSKKTKKHEIYHKQESYHISSYLNPLNNIICWLFCPPWTFLVAITCYPSFRGCGPLDTDLQKFAQICLSFICTSHHISLQSWVAFSTLKRWDPCITSLFREDHRRSKVVFATTAGSFERDCRLTAVQDCPSCLCKVHTMQFTKKVVGVKQAKAGPELWVLEKHFCIFQEFQE